MSIEVTVRHLDISETLQAYAREKSEKLMGEFPSIEFVRVVLDRDGPFYTAGVFAQGGQRTTVESDDKNSDMTQAINGAFDKAQTILRKNAQKRQEVR